MMRVFPAVKAEARVAAKQAVLLEMLREFIKALIEIRQSISTCSMRAMEFTAKTFPFSFRQPL